MTARIISGNDSGSPGPLSWNLQVDEIGYRTYKVRYQVQVDPGDDPYVAYSAIGLPVEGDTMTVIGGTDPWAWCRANIAVSQWVERENLGFYLDFTFSNKPDQRCMETQRQDPLLEPAKVSFSYVRYTEAYAFDRFGQRIENSAHEQITGHQVEFDRNRPQVKIEINVPEVNMGLIGAMMDTVNDAPLWGLPRRCVKLSDFHGDRKYFGLCEVYYSLSMTFDIRYETFDRDIADEGTKILHGHWGTKLTLQGCTTVDGSRDVTVPTVAGLYIGSTVQGTGIPTATGQSRGLPTVIQAIGNATTITMNNPANASGTAALNFQSPNWILDNIAGTPPNAANPTHFDRFKDRQGELTKCILNGAGLPATVSGTGFNYVSIQATNIGHVLTDEAWWLAIVGSTTPVIYGAAVDYKKGNLVEYAPLIPTEINVYIALVDSPSQTPPNPDIAPEQYYITIIDANTNNILSLGSKWQAVVGGINPVIWNDADNYFIGNLVVVEGSGIYVALTDNSASIPADDDSNPDWKFLVPAEIGLINSGQWSSVATYNLGQYVSPSDEWLYLVGTVPGLVNNGAYVSTVSYGKAVYVQDLTDNKPGNIHVEVYGESNLLLLGIPTSFGG